MAARGRRGARRLLVQALYQSQIAGHDFDELRAQFEELAEFADVDREYFIALLEAVLAGRDGLDESIAAATERSTAQLDPIEHAVLWIGIMELKTRREIPARVVINEAIELAKEFGAEGSYRFVNAILDRNAVHDERD